MDTRTTNIVVAILILGASLVGIFLSPSLPSEMASHWNFNGDVDGYMSKFWGIAMLPIVAGFLWLLFLVIPSLDPMKKNVDTFRKQFNTFVVLIISFLVYLYFLTLRWNLGYAFDLGRYMMLGMGVLFFYTGVLLSYSKRNWFIGIRTPWTLSSDKVWKKTHDIGAKLFKLSGVIIFLGFFIPVNPFLLIFVPVIGSSLFVVIYSYWIYKKSE